MLQVVQPGLAGLMDGSVSTLAPIFAAAFATHNSRDAFWWAWRRRSAPESPWGLPKRCPMTARSPGAGGPWCAAWLPALMTAGGRHGHTLPFLIASFNVAFAAAVIVVAIELAIISYVRHRYMDTPLLSSAFQVVVGGVLVFAVGNLDRQFVIFAWIEADPIVDQLDATRCARANRE